jgi:hypothetical protein
MFGFIFWVALLRQVRAVTLLISLPSPSLCLLIPPSCIPALISYEHLLSLNLRPVTLRYVSQLTRRIEIALSFGIGRVYGLFCLVRAAIPLRRPKLPQDIPSAFRSFCEHPSSRRKITDRKLYAEPRRKRVPAGLLLPIFACSRHARAGILRHDSNLISCFWSEELVCAEELVPDLLPVPWFWSV